MSGTMARAELVTPDEQARQARLNRMKRIATGLLVLSTVIFVVTLRLEPQYEWLGFVRATAEAAMVGALADWFAVTALFRHPLGIPIPHTAIVPQRKDQVGRALGNFVQKHFLSADVVGNRLRNAQVAERLSDWITKRENARRVARQVAVALAAGAKATREETIEELIEGAVTRKIDKTPVAPILARALTVITEDNKHQELLDEVVEMLSRAVARNQDFIRERIEEESPWWIPEKIDEKIAGKIVSSIDRTLQQIRENEQHPLRERFDHAIRDFIDRLQTSPSVIARTEAMKHEFLNAEAVRSFSSTIWDDMRASLVRQAESEDGRGLEAIERGLISFGEALKQDPELLAKADNWIIETSTDLVERYRQEVASLISETIAAWDPDATSRRIELAIGRDLQFIRINGTIVGGLAGLAIYTITRLAGG